jgi:mobilome CxxCx(11)CxxC protein
MSAQDFAKRCLEKEIYAYGTAFLFERRSGALRFGLRILSFLSLLVPLSVGGIALAGANSEWLPAIVTISGVLSVPLFGMTLWSLVFRWEERLATSVNSFKFNNDFKNKWNDLARYSGADAEDKYQKLLELDRAQEQSDILQDVSAKDKRRMMRASLVQYGRPCFTCGLLPSSLSAKSSKCGTCGDF